MGNNQKKGEVEEVGEDSRYNIVSVCSLGLCHNGHIYSCSHMYSYNIALDPSDMGMGILVEIDLPGIKR